MTNEAKDDKEDRLTRHRLFLATLVLMGLGWFYTCTSILNLPSVSSLRTAMPRTTSYIELARQETAITHQPVPLRQISRFLQQAVVIAEDSKFYEHNGIDWKAVKMAMHINWRRKRISHGASTLTMQLARNLYLSPHKTPLRKLRETLIALEMEIFLSKERILELYVNSVEWGNGVFGAEAAAQHYFNVSAARLNIHQAAFLAAILPNPRYYDEHRNTKLLQRRIRFIERRLGPTPSPMPLLPPIMTPSLPESLPPVPSDLSDTEEW